ncbi:MAG: 3-deoxy-7-phosphoheptulonate synthase [Clostridia bacterium]|jgi:3-deoxy-7-phosphoheptulonate synthase
MIIVMQSGSTQEDIKRVEEKLQTLGFKTHPIQGEVKTVIGAVGDKDRIDPQTLMRLPGVEAIVPIMRPYKLVSRELKGINTVIQIGDVKFGNGHVGIIAGPCAIEGEDQLLKVAQDVKKAGAHILRGGAYKPRTSPYSFQGLEEEGMRIMKAVASEVGMPIVTEVLDTRDVELVSEYVDILQVGARNMQNFRLLNEVGKSGKPVLLKRGLSATVEEWLMAAEYILSAGNPNVILCERGIRTFETATRNTMDINAIPLVKQLSHLPIIADPSHGTGSWKLVHPVALGVLAAGGDGLMIEVHHDPANATSDGPQSLRPEKFACLMEDVRSLVSALGKSLS